MNPKQTLVVHPDAIDKPQKIIHLKQSYLEGLKQILIYHINKTIMLNVIKCFRNI